jgi:endonuclease-3
MKVAEGVTEGIGVDTHVHRIAGRLGWVKNCKGPNETEGHLQLLFPKQYWNKMNCALVGFGQILCEAKKPRCDRCPVRKECPSSSLKEMF